MDEVTKAKSYGAGMGEELGPVIALIGGGAFTASGELAEKIRVSFPFGGFHSGGGL